MPPIDPCGCMVDRIRSAYQTLMRFTNDPAEVPVPVRWYFVPEGSPQLPFWTPFGSGNWAYIHEVPSWDGPGEVYPDYPHRPWKNGQPPHPIGNAGSPCGTPDQWAGLNPWPYVREPVGPGGEPLCCNGPRRIGLLYKRARILANPPIPPLLTGTLPKIALTASFTNPYIGELRKLGRVTEPPNIFYGKLPKTAFVATELTTQVKLPKVALASSFTNPYLGVLRKKAHTTNTIAATICSFCPAAPNPMYLHVTALSNGTCPDCTLLNGVIPCFRTADCIWESAPISGCGTQYSWIIRVTAAHVWTASLGSYPGHAIIANWTNLFGIRDCTLPKTLAFSAEGFAPICTVAHIPVIIDVS